MNTAERAASGISRKPLTILTLAGTIPSTYCQYSTYPHSKTRYRLQLCDEDNYRLVTPTEHRGERVVTRTKYYLVGSRDEIERRPTKPSLIASLSLRTWLPQQTPVANGRSAALARQRDHVESDQRNPYIWPRDFTGLGRREPIVLVSSHRVECPPNICRGVRLVGRPTLAAKQFREYSLFRPGMKA